MDKGKIISDLSQKLLERGEQSRIASAIGVSKSTVKRWTENADISTAHLKLLELYLYGTMPFEMLAPKEGYSSKLEFTESEWRVMDIMAKRAGFTETTKWIVSQIRSQLAYYESTKQKPSPLSIVAEDPPAYTTSRTQEYIFPGAVAAGQPVESERNETLTAASSLTPHNHVVYEINGESGGKDYPDGSRWLVEIFPGETRTARKNTPAVFRDSQGTYLKIWDGKRFKSVDPAHPDVQPDETLTLVGYPIEQVKDLD